MHAYVYVDYNKDKEFDITLNADGNNEGELVSYTFYSEDGGADGTNSLGDQKKNNVGANGALPRFILPENLSAGDYRIRFKIDWNSLAPCGSVISGNHIASNGGAIVDFTLRIESGDVAVKDVQDVPKTTFTGVTGGIMVQGQDCTADIYDGQGRLIIKKAVTNGSFVSLSAGTGTNDLYVRFFYENHLRFSPDMEVATTDQILPMVRCNLGIGFCPEGIARPAIEHKEVFEIELEEEIPERQITIVEDSGKPQSIAVQKLLTYFK